MARRVDHHEAEERLRTYYRSAESAAGYRSIHGALIDSKAGASKRSRGGAWMRPAHGDARSQRSPEDSWSPERCSTIRQCNRTAKALARLTSADQAYLAAVYAVDESFWRCYADQAFGAGVGLKLEQVFGDLVGVALLCVAVPDAWTPAATAVVQAGVYRESDLELRGRLASLGATALERRVRRMVLRRLSGHALDTAAAFYGRCRACEPRLPRGLPTARLRLDQHGAGGWLVAQLDGKAALAPTLERARTAHRGALAAFCGAMGLAGVAEREAARGAARGQQWHVATLPRVYGIAP
jgi:hypothetical protein